jgi:hypothetical protein
MNTKKDKRRNDKRKRREDETARDLLGRRSKE